MALREYEWRGQTWQFDEDAAPADAVPVEGSGDAAPAPKRSQARNKAAKPADK